MQLTWLVLASGLAVGVGYVAVRRARRLALVDWTLLCGSLFALATRDLFRTRERARPAHGGESATDGASRQSADGRSANHQSSGRSAPRRPNRGDDDPQRTPLFARLRRRVAGWLS